MILADTSVWIDHLRAGEPALAALLGNAKVVTHPFVLGELALGNLNNRRAILEWLKALPAAPVATHEEVLFLIEEQLLMGKGIGYVDAHLLASVSLSGRARLWTRDRRLRKVATSMGLAFEPGSPQTDG